MKSAPRPLRTERDFHGQNERPRTGGRGLPSAPPRPAPWLQCRSGGFTLVEVLAALLMMAIIIPVAMEGMSVASRIGVLGQRKAAAMRTAERVLNELIVEGQTQQASASGTTLEGEISYPWTMRSQSWSEDAMNEMIVTVTFMVQGNNYDVSASTLVAPASSSADGAITSQ